MALTLEYGPERSATSVPRVSAGRWHRPLLLLIAAELVLLFAPTTLWLVGRWTISVWHNAHGMFVPLVSAWLARQELKRRPDLPKASSAWGFAFLVPALVLHAIDAGLHTQLLSAAALLLAVPGLALLLIGAPRTWAIAFPIAFLLFALPIPLAFTEPVHLLLRTMIAGLTADVLPLLGVDVYLEDTTLHMTTGVVSVGDACSGFSTLYAAITFAALLAYMATSWRRRLLVLGAAVPVAIAANLLRVIALALMVAWGHAWLLDTFVHPLSGMLTFALALPVLLWLSEEKDPR